MFTQSPETDPQEPLTQEQQRVVAKVRRVSTISVLIMVLGLASVFGVIGYRMMRGKTVKAGEVTAALPKDAKILSTAVADRLLVLTLDVGGVIEVRTFDLETLAPAGRLRFAIEP